MSFLLVEPGVLETAAADLAQIGSAVSSGNLAAVIPTTGLAAAGADEVSAAIAAVFGGHAQEYQALAARAAEYYEQFVRTLSTAAGSFAATEATIATSMRGALDAVNAPVGQALTGSPVGRALGPIIDAFEHDLLGGLGTGATEKSIVIDFIRHGQTASNAANLIDTRVPGAGLNALGQQQAVAIANALKGQGPFAGIFASELTRSQATAGPLLGLLPGTNLQVLPGLNEISAGVFDGMPQFSPAGVLYLVGPVAWTLGFPLVPMLAPGSAHFNGVVFNQGFNHALQTMYGTAMANPVLAANGKITDVAFSSAVTMEVGTMMNVKNPDPFLMLTHPLPNAGSVVIQGNPQDGWTLVSWDGIPVPPASLPTELFVDVRDFIVAPQFAAYDILQTLPTGNPTAIVNAVADGVGEVGAAAVNFPFAVTRDLVNAVAG